MDKPYTVQRFPQKYVLFYEECSLNLEKIITGVPVDYQKISLFAMDHTWDLLTNPLNSQLRKIVLIYACASKQKINHTAIKLI